jgi:3-hydroxyisobutyrate dehydrogenase
MARIGFIGVGDMGGPMVRHLVDAGHDVRAFDRDDAALSAVVDAGATDGESAAGAVEGADIVLLSLPSPDEVTSVIDRIESALASGTVLVDTTTSRPATTNAIAGRLASQSVEVLGAPVSGGPSGAAAGTLTLIVGGDRAVLDACKPVLDAFADELFHVGDDPGDGHAAKLLNNYLTYTALVATSEAVVLGENAGLDGRQLVDVFSASTGRNRATEETFPEEILTGEYGYGFPLELAEKDTRLFTEFAREQDTPVLLGHVTHHLLGYARSVEGDDADRARVYEFLESVMTR